MSVVVSGKTIPEFKWSTSAFLDCTTVLYGATRSGKSTVIKHIMKVLQPHIDQVLVVSPTEVSNRAYEGMVDSTLIHERVWLEDPNSKAKKENNPNKCAIRFLDSVFDRQMMLSDMYRRATKIDTIESLYRRLPSSAKEEIKRYSELADRKKNTIVNLINHQYAFEPGIRESKINEVKEKFKNILLKVHKKFLRENYRYLMKQTDLSEDEKYALTYLDINPRLLIIFDDCAADLLKVFKSEAMRRYFYQGRHNYITLLLSCQNDKDIPVSLRTNAFVSIYTDLRNLVTSFEDKNNSHPREIREFVANAGKIVFSVPHRKFAYIRDDPSGQQFYWLKAQYPIKKFKFGSEALNELCSIVRQTNKKIDRNNPFYQSFAL
jgi:energy-coupling factor transporter ATP-binding protein EcfA2